MATYPSARKNSELFALFLLFLIAGCSRPPPTPLEEVEGFGSNPGRLRMFKYVPHALERRPPGQSARSPEEEGGAGVENPFVTGAPLVVALHGCMQDAAEFGEGSGWIRLADRWGFLLLIPEQQGRNYPTLCFNWYAPEDTRRDGGEALSIRQMVERMQDDHAIDPRRIYVTGISAGAAMSLVLATLYPDVFAGAAPIAGIPFGCADGLLSALGCMWDPPDKNAAQWGAAVRSATSHRGPWPRISVWQGEADSAVDPANASAIVRQWTDVHGIAETPTRSDKEMGHLHGIYQDATGQALVESYRIEGMGHGLPIDPGPGENRCGKVGKFFPDVDICSSLWIARFWGIAPSRSDRSRDRIGKAAR